MSEMLSATTSLPVPQLHEDAHARMARHCLRELDRWDHKAGGYYHVTNRLSGIVCVMGFVPPAEVTKMLGRWEYA